MSTYTCTYLDDSVKISPVVCVIIGLQGDHEVRLKEVTSTEHVAVLGGQLSIH